MKKTKEKSIGAQMIESLQEFAEALERGADISKEFRCRTVVVKPRQNGRDANLVKTTRKLLHASQSALARFLGVSVQTLRTWEKGTDQPPEVACRFMEEMRHDPGRWRTRIRERTSLNGQHVT